MSAAIHRPLMSEAGLAPTHHVTAVDEFGQNRQVQVAGESPLTLKVDGKEVVTLMTLGTQPEALALGYLRNQRLVGSIDEIAKIEVQWDLETVFVTTTHGRGIIDWENKLANRTITSGCGQGTIFSCTIDSIYNTRLAPVKVRQSMLYTLLSNISQYNQVYRQAGAVHGCALCHGTEILSFVEDVGRHNAADAISGQMWLEGLDGKDKLFYTTGRLTSEMVMKTAQMGIPVLLSRSGVTEMGLELAGIVGMTMIARAKGRHFLVYNGVQDMVYDAIPTRRAKGGQHPPGQPGAGARSKSTN
ncbi:MAG: sulfurtransferase FdhD [Gammaproteobacteria bacterium]|nr:sulfurtransferase FdhD [Gammaproteobacteria bacterium]